LVLLPIPGFVFWVCRRYGLTPIVSLHGLVIMSERNGLAPGRVPGGGPSSKDSGTSLRKTRICPGESNSFGLRASLPSRLREGPCPLGPPTAFSGISPWSFSTGPYVQSLQRPLVHPIRTYSPCASGRDEDKTWGNLTPGSRNWEKTDFHGDRVSRLHY
jgi:hypothetical protein